MVLANKLVSGTLKAMESTAPKVGTRIRALREERKFSLRSLAERSGLSVNAIGMIERGENSPTVSSLHTLANALEVNIVDFFEEPREYETIFVRKNQRLATRGANLEMESLGYGIRNQQLEPFFVTLTQPGTSGPSEDSDLVEHPGQEFVYCITGVVVYEIAGVTYRLEAGDSILFEASQPHRFRNDGPGPGEVIIVFQAAEGTHLARERHLSV